MKQTAVEWLIKEFNLENYTATCQFALEKERRQMATNCNQLEKPHLILGDVDIQILELTNDEIIKVAERIDAGISPIKRDFFIKGAFWYREQLKQK
jgi:hypothetical protein